MLFEEVEGDEARVKDASSLKTVASLLQLDVNETEKALCSRVVAARGEVMQKGHDLQQALYGRDAFTKVRPGSGCNLPRKYKK